MNPEQLVCHVWWELLYGFSLNSLKSVAEIQDVNVVSQPVTVGKRNIKALTPFYHLEGRRRCSLFGHQHWLILFLSP